MAAIGEIDIVALAVRRASEFHQQIAQAQPGAGARPTYLVARISNPGAQPDVEDGKQERCGWRRVEAPVGTDRRSGNGHRPSDANTFFRKRVVFSGPIAVKTDSLAPVRRAPFFGGRGCESAELRGERKSFRLALLPCQFLA